MCGFSKQTNKELFAYYKKHLPKKVIKKALKSSGNIHNPAIVPLSKAFPDAFKSTTFFKDIESALGEHCYKLYGMDREKFSIDTKNIHIWQPDIWLRFQKNDKCK